MVTEDILIISSVGMLISLSDNTINLNTEEFY